MTEHDRRTFMGSLAALFAGFTTAGASELELIQATDQFLEDPGGEEEASSSSSESSVVSSVSRSRSGDSGYCKHYDSFGSAYQCKDCPKQYKCNFFNRKALQ